MIARGAARTCVGGVRLARRSVRADAALRRYSEDEMFDPALFPRLTISLAMVWSRKRSLYMDMDASTGAE